MYLSVLLLAQLVQLSHQHAGHAHSAIPSAQMNSSLATLCSDNATSTPFSVGCTLLDDCTRQITTSSDGLLAASSVGTELPTPRNATECKATALYAATCNDPASIRNPACGAFRTLCVTGNGTDPLCEAVETIPLEDYNLTTYVCMCWHLVCIWYVTLWITQTKHVLQKNALHRYQAWDTLQGLCAYHAAHLGRIYNLTTGVSTIDPAARRRRSLLHNGEDHSSSTGKGGVNMTMSSGALNNTGVPHTESAHEYCAAV